MIDPHGIMQPDPLRLWTDHSRHNLEVSQLNGEVRIESWYPGQGTDIHILTPIQARQLADHLRACADVADTELDNAHA